MLKNYLSVALRTLSRQPVYGLINVTGLAVGMACCLLILLLVRHEWSFDRFHEHIDRIHRVVIVETQPDGGIDHRILMPPALAPDIAAEFGGITLATRVVGGRLNVRHQNELIQEDVYMADSTFLDIFTFPLLAGHAATALDEPENAVITARTADKYFDTSAGYDRVLGERLTIERGEQRYDFTVSGVLASIPRTSSLNWDILLSFRQYETIRIGANDWGGRTSLYLLLEESQDPQALVEAFPPFTEVQFAERIAARRAGGFIAARDDAFRLVLQPFRALHLDPEIGIAYERPVHNPLFSYILSGIALLVLFIACVNFMTLSLGRSTSRAREVGIRKVLGAHRKQLMGQFWGEALLLSSLALLVSLLLVEAALPIFNQLTGQQLAFRLFGDSGTLLALLGLTAIVAFVAGGYPAAVLSRYQPAHVLKGGLIASSGSRFTGGLVVLQYAISIGLIICTLVMYRQLDYMLSKDLGFRGEQVVVVQTGHLNRQQERMVLSVFRQELRPYEQVRHVIGTGYAFTQSYDTKGWLAADGTPRGAHMIGVDYGYLDALEMELVAGRDFSPDFSSDSTRSVLVNEAFVREFAISEPIGHVLSGFGGFFGEIDPTIIGVVKDFNFRPLHDVVEPAVLNMHPNYYMGMQAMLVKVQPDDLTGTLALLERTWKGILPERPFSYTFMNEDIANQYLTEQRWSRIITYSALLAILIACMGLFGLATLSVARRTKEIGIRKVLGASMPGLLVLLSREFAVLVAVAAVIASPIAYLAMQRWLDDFAYRVAVPWWAFAAAAITALAIALATVSYQAFRTAMSDPVKSLRHE